MHGTIGGITLRRGNHVGREEGPFGPLFEGFFRPTVIPAGSICSVRGIGNLCLLCRCQGLCRALENGQSLLGRAVILSRVELDGGEIGYGD